MTKGLNRSLERQPVIGSLNIKQKIVELNDLEVVVASTGDANKGGGTQVGTWAEEGWIIFLGFVGEQISITSEDAALSDTWAGELGIGDALMAKGDTNLSGFEGNFVEASVGPAVSKDIAAADYFMSIFDAGDPRNNTDGDQLVLAVNIQVDNADATDDTDITLTVNGRIIISYLVLGDD